MSNKYLEMRLEEIEAKFESSKSSSEIRSLLFDLDDLQLALFRLALLSPTSDKLSHLLKIDSQIANLKETIYSRIKRPL